MACSLSRRLVMIVSQVKVASLDIPDKVFICDLEGLIWIFGSEEVLVHCDKSTFVCGA